MSKLSKAAIEDFKENMRKVHNIELTDEQAEEMGWNLLKISAITLRSKFFKEEE